MADKRIIEGRNPVREALLGHCQIDEIIISAGPSSPGLRDIVRLAQDRHIRVKRVTQEEMARLSRSRSHQGVIAVCPPY